MKGMSRGHELIFPFSWSKDFRQFMAALCLFQVLVEKAAEKSAF